MSQKYPLDPRFNTPATTRVHSADALGALLRQRRKELGYTQQDIADMTGWSPRLIGELERGRATVGIGRVIDYANGLGVDIDLKVRGK